MLDALALRGQQLDELGLGGGLGRAGSRALLVGSSRRHGVTVSVGVGLVVPAGAGRASVREGSG